MMWDEEDEDELIDPPTTPHAADNSAPVPKNEPDASDPLDGGADDQHDDSSDVSPPPPPPGIGATPWRLQELLDEERARVATLTAELAATTQALEEARTEASAANAQLAEREAALTVAEEALSALLPAETVQAVREGRPIDGLISSAPPSVASETREGAEPPSATHSPPVGGVSPTQSPLAPGTDGRTQPGGGKAGEAAAAAEKVIAGSGPSTKATPNAGALEPTGGSESIVERLAEYAIEGAKSDSVVTNPTMAISGLIEFVNEWRDALAPEPGQPSHDGAGVVEAPGAAESVTSERLIEGARSHITSLSRAFFGDVAPPSAAAKTSSNVQLELPRD